MRSRQAFVAAALILGLSSCGDSSDPNGDVFSAKVTNGELHLTLPLENRTTWDWDQASAAVGELEYKWTGTVTNGGERFEFGFFKWKLPGSTPENGTLEQLLQNGQSNVFMLDAGGQGEIVPGQVGTFASADSLVIRVVDPETLGLLTSEHPDEITLTRVERSRPTVTRTVPLVYQ